MDADKTLSQATSGLKLDEHAPNNDEDLFATPITLPSANHKPSNPHSTTKSAETRDLQLRAELARLQEINRVITSVTTALTQARNNMDVVQSTVQSASTLLGTWTRILAQTEHNQRLILDPSWGGAGKDIEEMEGEEVRRREEGERKVAEEARRREEAARVAAEEERRKVAAANAAASSGARGLGRRGSTRGSSGGRGYVGVGGQAGRGRGSVGGRGGSRIGRGVAARGRGRGVG